MAQMILNKWNRSHSSQGPRGSGSFLLARQSNHARMNYSPRTEQLLAMRTQELQAKVDTLERRVRQQSIELSQKSRLAAHLATTGRNALATLARRVPPFAAPARAPARSSRLTTKAAATPPSQGLDRPRASRWSKVGATGNHQQARSRTGRAVSRGASKQSSCCRS